MAGINRLLSKENKILKRENGILKRAISVFYSVDKSKIMSIIANLSEIYSIVELKNGTYSLFHTSRASIYITDDYAYEICTSKNIASVRDKLLIIYQNFVEELVEKNIKYNIDEPLAIACFNYSKITDKST